MELLIQRTESLFPEEVPSTIFIALSEKKIIVMITWVRVPAALVQTTQIFPDPRRVWKLAGYP